MVSLTQLQEIPFFRGFEPTGLELIAGMMVERSFQPGQEIFLEGETSAGLWFVVRGRVKAYRLDLSGKEQVLCLIGPQTCFGGCPIFDGDTYPAMAQAIDEVTLYILPRAEALALAEESPQTARALLHVFAGRLRHLSRLAETLTFKCVTDRLATLLLEHADEGGVVTENAIELHLNLTQDELAALLGTVRQVVSRALLRLERLGAIEARGRHIRILNPDKLRQLA